MKKTNLDCLKVAFYEYFLIVGVKIKMHSITQGVLLKYSKINTPNGLEKIGIVLSDDSEIFYVPKSSIISID